MARKDRRKSLHDQVQKSVEKGAEVAIGRVADSSYGREHGGFGMKEFVNIKAVYLP